MDEVRIPEAEEERSCLCYDGFHYVGHLVESSDDLETEVEVIERVRCKRCSKAERGER